MKRPLLISMLILLLAQASVAASLRNYENRVTRAAEQIERIKADSEYSEQGLETIRELLPRSEKIEHEGKTASVDNNWLYLSLDSYTSEKDPQGKLAKLNEIGGRLRALDEQLVRAEETSASKTDSTDARSKINKILERSEYREKQDSRIGAFIKEVWRKIGDFLSELYAAFMRLLGKLFGSTAQSSLFAKILIIAVLVAAVILIMGVVKQIKPRKKRARKRTILGEELDAATTPRDLADAAMAAARAGDFRTAIRKLYISLLYDLAERNVIELEDSATNHEYLARLSRFNSLTAPVGYLTDRFDYCWYGMTPSSEEEFSTCLARYKEAMDRAQSLDPQAAS
jgi:hypothetical protein